MNLFLSDRFENSNRIQRFYKRVLDTTFSANTVLISDECLISRLMDWIEVVAWTKKRWLWHLAQVLPKCLYGEGETRITQLDSHSIFALSGLYIP